MRIDSLLDKAEDHPVCSEECANAGCVGATLRFKQEKRRTSWQLCQALDDYSLSLPKVLFNRAASNLDRTKNQAIAKKSGCVRASAHMCAGRHNSSAVSVVLVCTSDNFKNFDVGSYEFVKY